ncbi:FG-GAP-like repeat-containing protein [Thalassoroseus pseudoceratinae]|uniref:FG-GAP-like repeat-containing protein n=1 Tax=Thalassoroseus pseudoceratinae TaxID=2713176 RepID=UPI0014246AD4|nr:FG-GAP-like repeat-containing protein [Thalassoroseus pseudoceratinae]
MLNGFREFLRDLRRVPTIRRPSRLKGRNRRRAQYGSAVEALETKTLLTSAVVPFAMPEVVSTAPEGPVGADVADFDADGDTDLLVPSFSSVSWLPLDGGSFGDAIPVAAVGADAALAGDLDGDGSQDVIVAETGVGLAWYSNDGSGTFGARQAIVDLPGVSQGTLGVSLADIDGDGDLDAVANNQEVGEITWYGNDGDGNFSTGGTLPFNVPYTFGLAFDDLDGDGDLDVAAANFPLNQVLWAANDGSGNFGMPQTVTSDLSGPFSVLAVDLDGDADKDLVSASYDNKVAWYENDGSGNFGSQQVLTSAVLTPYRLSAEDLDGNGNVDLLVGSGANGEVVWLPGDGAGDFDAPRTIASTGGTAIMATPVVDLDGDGDKDVLAAAYATAVFRSENLTGESATAILKPAAGTYRTGQFVDVGVYFGSPVTVTGTPIIPGTVDGSPVEFAYVGGSGTNTLTFRYVVLAGADDMDGVELGAAINPNGGSLLDVVGDEITGNGLDVPATDLSDVLIDGIAPLVSAITRTDDNPTAERFVQFHVEFDQSVSGVDVADFEVIADGVTGAVVTEVQGNGSSYMVTVGTGTGIGTIRLDVLDAATITNVGGSSLGTGFIGGEVYTLNRRPVRTISNFYTSGHADLGVNFVDGNWDLSFHIDNPAGDFAPDEVLTVGGPSSAETTPSGAEWAFLGETDDTVYVLPGSPTPDLPFLGLGAEETTPGTFAAYLEADPRVNTTSRWIRLDLADVRGPAGGEFSMYSIGIEGPRVWMASSDGIDMDDAYWLREGSHDHTIMAFTEPGIYEVDVVASGFLDANGNGTLDPGVDPYSESAVTTLYFQINESGEPTPVTLPADPLPPVAVPFALPEVVMPEPGYAYNTIGTDLNGDGLPDALVNGFADVTFLTEVVWAPNLGDGTFGERQTILPGTSDFIGNVFSVDADQDGDLDVVIVGGTTFHYHPNDGNGNFGAPVPIAGAGGHRDAVGGDLDGDGDVDFASVSNDGVVRLFRNLNGTYIAEEIATGLTGGNAMIAFDADVDGDIDLVVGSNDVEQITLFVNDGTGGFSSSVLADSDIDVRNLYSGDLDGDGLIDIVSTSYFASELAYYRNLGNNTFEKRVVAVDESGVFGGDVGDIDGDGDLDLVAAGFDDTSVSWYANDGTGSFGDRQIIAIDGSPKFSMFDASLADFNGDGQMDVIAGDVDNPFAIVVHENQLSFFANQMIVPEDGIYLQDAAIDLHVHFGVPVDVTGTPAIELQIGDQTVTAEYLSGTGTPTLTFRYSVQGDDSDLNGIALASMMVSLPTGAAMTDPVGDDVDRTLPMADLSGVVINGSAPRVASITRLGPAATAAQSVRFAVTFNEPVTGITTETFAANFGGSLTGAAVTDVSGDGTEYVVTVDTGTGSGALGLTNGVAGIVDLEGNPLATPVLGGEVYTLQRRPARQITEFFTGGHADITMEYRENLWTFEAPGSDLDVSEVLIVGGPDSMVPAPSSNEFAFLGAEPGSHIYLLPQSGAPPMVPDLGISTSTSPRNAFATYTNMDPRVDSDAAWIEMQLLGMRGPEGGQFSLYNSSLDEPTVWMASSDGIDDSDSLFTPASSHGHYNWAFTKPGVYEIDVFASGFLDANGNGTFDEGIDPYSESGITTLYFSIDPPNGPQPHTIAADAPSPLMPQMATVVDEGVDNEMINGNYQHVVSGNFDAMPTGAGAEGDDLLFWDPVSGEHRIVFGDGTVQDNPFATTMINGSDFTQVVTGDFDGGGGTDLLFWHPSTGSNRLIHVNGETGNIAGTVESNVVPATSVNGNDFAQLVVGDFDGGEVDDLFFWDPTTGRNRFVHLEVVTPGSDTDFNNHQTDVIPTTLINGDYSTVKVGQFAVGGLDELLFIDMGSGQNRIVSLSTEDADTTTAFEDVVTNYFPTTLFNGNEFDRVEVADLNGDGLDDVFAWNSNTGPNRLASTSLNLETPPVAIDDAIGFQGINGDYELIARLTEDVFSDPNSDELFFWNPTTGRNRTGFVQS